MLEKIVAIGFVVAVVGALVGLALWIRRLDVTVVRGKPKQKPREFLSDADIDQLLITDAEPEENEDEE